MAHLYETFLKLKATSSVFLFYPTKPNDIFLTFNMLGLMGMFGCFFAWKKIKIKYRSDYKIAAD